MSVFSVPRMLVALAAMAARCPEPARAAEIKRVELVNEARPGEPRGLANAAALEKTLQVFAGRADSASQREALADAVLQHYQTAGWPVVDVSVERARGGVVRVHISEGRFGRISVEGGTASMRQAVLAPWQRRAGTPLTAEAISTELDWVHRNPLHAATAGFAPGEVPATADTTVTLQGTRSWQFATGYRDDGSPPLERGRFFARVEQADALGIPSWWSLEGTTAADPDEYRSLNGSLRIFLPSHREVVLGGYVAQAGSTTALLPGFDAVSELEAWNVSARLVTPLPAWRGWHSDLSAGAEFCRLDSAVETGCVAVDGTADTLLLTAAVSANRRRGAWRTDVDAGILWSPGGITDAADDADHAALRYGASADYTMLRAGARVQRDFDNGWTALGRASGQWTSEPVVPVQEFSPAGAQGVRGFASSSVLGDSGLLGSLEILTPLLPVPEAVSGLRLRAAAFLDAAVVHDAVHDTDDSPASAGAGLRLQWHQSLGMAVDYGWRLTDPGGRLHVSLRLEF